MTTRRRDGARITQTAWREFWTASMVTLVGQLKSEAGLRAMEVVHAAVETAKSDEAGGTTTDEVTFSLSVRVGSRSATIERRRYKWCRVIHADGSYTEAFARLDRPEADATPRQIELATGNGSLAG